MQNFKELLYSDHIYNYDQIDDVMKIVRTNFRFSQINTRHKYFNVPSALDLETSSFYDHNQKVGLMYVWMFGIYGLVIVGRTWEQLHSMLTRLCEILDLHHDKRLVVYVHNLQFDFQFFRTHFSFTKVFAIDSRKPLYALTDQGLEFRCSYLLSGYSLATLGKNLINYPVEKLAGDLDYNLIRHQGTPLTKKELAYCVNDVKVVMSFIAEEIDNSERGIASLPLTKTGYVRNYCRNSCFYEPGIAKKKSLKRLRYREIMQRLTLDPELYQWLKYGFAGGFTHSSSLYAMQTVYNVSSYDFTSSYPAVMIAEKYPMGVPELVNCKTLTKERFEELLKYYCCLFTVHLYGVKEKPEVYDNYISRSKCLRVERPLVNNGRIVSADYLSIVITELDWDIINACYDFKTYQVSDLYIWIKGYLPKDFILSILKLYVDKTELKGVKGKGNEHKEQEYNVKKGMLNACYGMAVTDIVRNEYIYSDQWEDPKKPDLEFEINRYNSKADRFLYYPWGVWVTAYARRNLFTGIISAGEDYIYSDTDSIKLINAEKHQDYFDKYNAMITRKLEQTLKHYDIDPAMIRPKTIKGVEKPLGVWDYEGTYTRFKSLGAKRYLLEKDGEIEMTVSGLNKRVTVPYLKEKYKVEDDILATNDNIFAAFEDGLSIPAEYTGKQTHTYIDQERRGVITDYMGNAAEYSELSSVHLEPAEYSLDATNFKTFLLNRLKGIKQI